MTHPSDQVLQNLWEKVFVEVIGQLVSTTGPDNQLHEKRIITSAGKMADAAVEEFRKRTEHS